MNFLRAYKKDVSGVTETPPLTVPLVVDTPSVRAVTLPVSRFASSAGGESGSAFTLPPPTSTATKKQQEGATKRARVEEDEESNLQQKRTVKDDDDDDDNEDDDECFVAALPALREHVTPVPEPKQQLKQQQQQREPQEQQQQHHESSYGPARPTTQDVQYYYPEVQPAPVVEFTPAVPSVRAQSSNSTTQHQQQEHYQQQQQQARVFEVSQRDLLRDQAELQTTLAHELKGGSAAPMNAGGKRHHQLGKMATEALQNMERLQNEKLKNTKTIGQVRMKYGWH
jgi:hypothetical protein